MPPQHELWIIAVSFKKRAFVSGIGPIEFDPWVLFRGKILGALLYSAVVKTG